MTSTLHWFETELLTREKIYKALETRDAGYAVRIPANKNLKLEIEDIPFRSPGRPSRKPLIR